MQCKCGHMTGETCPDCGAPICEECARQGRVILLSGGPDKGYGGVADQDWLFCPECAKREDFYSALWEVWITHPRREETPAD